ncbi:MAG: twin-arginine translocase subunit TatC [Candidatus Omnitrophica bacterium]|nr:twin-arginine translocase subunit TatC [Candidatus Omnitrophota bacterium]
MDKPLTLVEHLDELRKRIIICLVVLGITTAASFPFASHILKVIKIPAAGVITRLVFFSPQEGFLIYMRIAFLCAWVVSLPVILYQLWLFISPAIEKRLKRYSAYFILFCFVAFILGGLFAYFILIPPALRFLLSFAKGELQPVISANRYISFTTGLILGCGLVFQMPVLSFILAKLRIINSRILRKKYKYAVLIIFILAAIITPTSDIFNMLILALPMLCLYEVSIWISHLARPRQKNTLRTPSGDIQ